ncbi:MarR family transcriptional regulator [Candidatus Woesearchaeota archaeon]|nr:MarR family transcriptional regulator [Candidatus Woesearchaeota archaeon]
MVELTHKLLGSALIGLSIILLFILVFVKINSDREGAFLCEVVANDPTLSMDECPAHESSTSWLILLAFGIGMIMLVSGSVLIFRSQAGETKKRHIPVDRSKLSEEEKKILELLEQNEGSMYQSDIIRDTQHSKVYVTRLLDRLEGKHVIERKRRGMTNIVVLK